jgi:hypothetical protein
MCAIPHAPDLDSRIDALLREQPDSIIRALSGAARRSTCQAALQIDLIIDLYRPGHRGARDIYPENSLPSIEYAISEAGVDVVEFDIHMSKDGELFLNHDPVIPGDRYARSQSQDGL